MSKGTFTDVAAHLLVRPHCVQNDQTDQSVYMYVHICGMYRFLAAVPKLYSIIIYNGQVKFLSVQLRNLSNEIHHFSVRDLITQKGCINNYWVF